VDQTFDGQGLSFIFTTIRRDNCARRLIDSALSFYPRLKILVADQNPPTEAMAAFYRDRGVEAHWTPFDFGVSAGRALLARKVTTPLLVYGDDDFVFTRQTRFAPVARYLAARPDVALVTGGMVDQYAGKDGQPYRARRRYETYLYRDRSHRGLIAVPIDHVRPKVDVFEGELFYRCDLGLNWAMARTSLFDDDRFLWDGQFKTNGEHENFFLQLQEFGGGKVMFYPFMECDHVPETHADYELLRGRDHGWAAFGRKWDVDWFLHVGKSFHQYSHYTASTVRFAAGGQGGAAHLPPRNDDYLRIWANGSSVASVSDGQILREANERTRLAWEKADKRIETLRARVQNTEAENERMTGVIAGLRTRGKSLEAENSQLRRRLAELEAGAPSPSRDDVAATPGDATAAQLRERNAELRDKTARQKEENERLRAVIEDLRHKLKDGARAVASHKDA
jgi:hypothetical protein